ncbi:MAG TPA: DUF3343 domain-containing protein [Gammaproteobacteria bacterium]|nr:DUF3343 domain-containing protein [Gammaproteobacteria bacterium]
MSTILTFDTSHHALWAEQVATRQQLGAQIIPAPSEAKAGCGLALECLDEDVPALRQALQEQGVPYAVYVRTSGGAAGRG